ncbi:P44/Msp2 family outer membrane protein [Ehrlichia japonica]|uniref:Surface antigen family protein n=1 Tax=Ehrlichia japonica TaxID=391036 RepID=X5GCH3_9RICK|nr:P44/Msp2 family outer membrane protein [Ehrlichia japonica]AHX04802.1 surface antigen family protein [Ehrlichia japonica]
MYNKINYIVMHTIILVILLLPVKSSSALIDNMEKDAKASNIYVSSQYKPSIPHFRNFSIHEANSKIKNSVESEKNIIINLSSILKSNTHNTIPYNLQFQDNTTSFSGTIGYSSRGLRLEAEGSYEEFYIKNFNESLIISSSKYYSETYNINPQSVAFARDNKLSITSIMVNTCYDISISHTSAVPYLCTGIGGDFIGLFNATYFKLAYQGKIGVSYLINNNILLFSDIYYHKVMGNEFKNLYIQHVANSNISAEVIPVLANLDIGYFGSEIGVRFIFN